MHCTKMDTLGFKIIVAEGYLKGRSVRVPTSSRWLHLLL